MDLEKIRAEIMQKYEAAGKAGQEFAARLYDLRNINFDVDSNNKDEVQKSMEIGREIDTRTCYLLKLLLMQHGNVLFL